MKKNNWINIMIKDGIQKLTELNGIYKKSIMIEAANFKISTPNEKKQLKLIL
jgi:hypothetical protein